MTLGNDPQPLTRRQARERAQNQEPEQSVENPEQQPAKSTSRRAGTDSAIQAGDTPRFTNTPARAESSPASPSAATPVSSFAPRSASAQEAPQEEAPQEDAPQGKSTPERTLTRRELRALKAAEEAKSGAVQDSGESEPEGNDGVGYERPSQDDVSGSDPHTQVVDGGQPFDQLISRGVGAGGIPTTSNALILPSVPQQGTRSGPLTSTGEILITGSIDLPRSLGSTGQHPNHFDSSEMDHMLDQLDEGAVTSSVAPVSASRAVSTHASTRGVMTPPRKTGVSLPSVLAITAAVLAAGVVALFIVGYILKIF